MDGQEAQDGCPVEWLHHVYPSGAVYRGSALGGKREGRGWWRHPSGETYEGEYHNNQQHGWGVYCFPDTGRQYRGHWAHGKMHGQGVFLFSADGVEFYAGGYDADRKDGAGLYQYADGRVSAQQWHAGELIEEVDATPQQRLEGLILALRAGEQCAAVGRCPAVVEKQLGNRAADVAQEFDLRLDYRNHLFPSGARYDGQFLQLRKHGDGLWEHPDGDWYDGQFRNNRHCGWGVYAIGRSGKKYVGAWADGRMDGWGVYYFNPQETEYFVGVYCEDRKHGSGLYVFASGGARLQRWDRGRLVEEVVADSETHRQYDDVRRKLMLTVQRHAKRYKPSPESLATRAYGLG